MKKSKVCNLRILEIQSAVPPMSQVKSISTRVKRKKGRGNCQSVKILGLPPPSAPCLPLHLFFIVHFEEQLQIRGCLLLLPRVLKKWEFRVITSGHEKKIRQRRQQNYKQRGSQCLSRPRCVCQTWGLNFKFECRLKYLSKMLKSTLNCEFCWVYFKRSEMFLFRVHIK